MVLTRGQLSNTIYSSRREYECQSALNRPPRSACHAETHEEKFTLAEGNSCDPVIVALYETQAERLDLGMHSHRCGQLSGLRKGFLTMGTETGAWLIPADHAVWLPPQQPHYGYTHGAVEGRICCIAEPACVNMPDCPCMVQASGLLREAVIRASGWQEREMSESQLRIAMVILDELRVAPTEPFGLPMPRDPRLFRIARALLDHPGDPRGLDEWAEWAGCRDRLYLYILAAPRPTDAGA